MPLVDSKRHAAFRLGYHGRLLRSLLWAGIAGKTIEPQDVLGCIQIIEDAFLVLAEEHGAAQYSILIPLMRQAAELHNAVSEIEPSEEADIEKGAFQKVEHDKLERIDFLLRRVVQRDSALRAWREVGNALAELRHRVAFVYESVPIPVADWNQLNSAVDRLPLEDRSNAEPFTVNMKYSSLDDLAAQILEVYGDICQCLYSSDYQQERGTDTSEEQVRLPSATTPTAQAASSPTMVDDTTGLTHTETYSICKSKSNIYNLLHPARVIVHSMNEWRREGVKSVLKDDIFKKAMKIYLHDRKMTEVLESIYARQISKVLEDSGAWKTLVQPMPGRKGLYTLDL